MKKILFFLIVVGSLLTNEVYAKRSLMSKKVDEITQSIAASCNIKIEKATKNLYFFTTMTTFGEIRMIKGEGNYSLIVKYGALPKYVNAVNNLYLIISNGDTLKLNICGNKLDIQGGENMNIVYHNYTNNNNPIGVISIPTSDVSYYLYEIEKEKLQEIADNEINSINIYYTSANSDVGSEIDKNKDKYLEYKISNHTKPYLTSAAQNILGD